MTRQQVCAELGISESTVRRLEQAGLPFTTIGRRTKRYDMEECKAWLRQTYRPDGSLEGTSKDVKNLAGEINGKARVTNTRVKPGKK